MGQIIYFGMLVNLVHILWQIMTIDLSHNVWKQSHN